MKEPSSSPSPRAGPEIGVAATKTFLAQIAALDLLALELARARGAVSEEELMKLGRDLRRAPEKVEETLGLLGGRVAEAARVFKEARCALFLGRGPSYPVALEGALELQEMLGPFVCSVPLQLLAYRVAKDRGCDVDKPRNLAKSVTVE